MVEGTTASTLVPVPDHVIERPRLTKLLADSGARVILLAAPAGYGKTTLARQWRAKQSGPVVWYRTTRASGDVAALAVGLDQVLAATVPQPGRDPKRVASIASVNARPGPLARALVKIYGRLTRNVLLIVDEYETAGTAEAEELFGLLVEQLDIRFLVTSRTRPSWFEPRLTIYGEALEVGADQLTMTDEEALAVLSRHPRREDLGPLLATARGWPAVIGLAAMRGEDLPSPEIPARILYDFLASEMLDSAPPEIRSGLTLLAAASVTDIGTAKLLLAGETKSILDEARQRGLVQLDDDTSLSLHPLLRDVILSRLRAPFDPESVLPVERLQPLIEGKRWDEALAAAEAQPDPTFVSSAMAEALPEIVRTGRIATLRRWIAVGQTAGVVEGLVSYATAELALRDADFVRAIALAERAVALLQGDYAARAHLAAGRAAHLADRGERAMRHFQSAELLATTQEVRAAALWGMLARALDDEREDASRLLEEFEAASDGTIDRTLRSAEGEIRIGMLDGHLSERLADAEMAVLLLGPEADPMARTSLLNNYAAAHALLAQYDRALKAAQEEIRVADEYGIEFVHRHGLLNKARAAIGLRRLSIAERALSELERKLKIRSDIFLEANALIARARLFITAGDLQRAYGALFFDFDRNLNRGARGEYLALRALVAAGLAQNKEALALAETAAELSRNVHTLSVANIARAVIAEGADFSSYVDATIEAGGLDAIVLGCRTAPAFAARLVGHDAYRRLVAALLTRSNDSALARRVGLIIPRSTRHDGVLSPREREIHELIAQGMTNREIAKLLFISESTAKVHVRHILEKLGVRSRVEAARIWPDAEAVSES